MTNPSQFILPNTCSPFRSSQNKRIAVFKSLTASDVKSYLAAFLRSLATHTIKTSKIVLTALAVLFLESIIPGVILKASQTTEVPTELPAAMPPSLPPALLTPPRKPPRPTTTPSPASHAELASQNALPPLPPGPPPRFTLNRTTPTRSPTPLALTSPTAQSVSNPPPIPPLTRSF